MTRPDPVQPTSASDLPGPRGSRSTSINCSRRTLLLGTAVSAGLLATGGGTWLAVAESGVECRQWCLEFSDNECRRGNRPACAPLSVS